MATTKLQYLANLTWPEAKTALDGAIAILPIGAIEAHGPHLPLDTDVIIAREMAYRTGTALARTRKVLILPEIAYGFTFAGTCFPGTTGTSPQALLQTITEVLVTTLDNGASAAIIVNAHLEPAHVQVLHDAAERSSGATQKPVAFPDIRQPRWAERLSEEFRAGMRHAGAYETSLILAANPEAVHSDMLPHLPAVLVDLPAALRAGARYFDEAGGTMGYFGNPGTATAEEGEQLFAALVGIACEALAEVERETARS